MNSSLPVTVRLAKLDDVAQIAAVHARSREAADADLAPELVEQIVAKFCSQQRWFASMNEQDIPPDLFFVAEIAGVVVGFIQPEPLAEGSGEMVIDRLFVTPSAWGTGAAQALVDHELDEARRRGVSRVTLWSGAFPRSRRFYEKVGFLYSGQERPFEIIPGCVRPQYRYSITLGNGSSDGALTS